MMVLTISAQEFPERSLQFVWTSSPHRNRKRFDCSKCPEIIGI
ncbi:unnamed protein product [Acanthoscelides obtectus]|uniref:Uncharacterized protein n=1 Tax=Acanthoscelides obtectus TaxID=200917 RepID=A0A9P0LZ32_ACAOB|nr:unnamed protein product [Acanthoscelides obtectus]CAK1638932.1 hypothetical protein AOBTE_LOCUS10892 [Acanthoscelides obtectus]